MSGDNSFDSSSTAGIASGSSVVVETITNQLPSRRRDMPLDETGLPVARIGKSRGQEHDYFEHVGQSGRLELVKCHFCGLERTRISLRMRDHLARKCPGAIPAELRQQFLRSLPAFKRANEAAAIAAAGASTPAANGYKRKIDSMQTTGSFVKKSDHMIRTEHELKMKKMKAELELAEEQKRIVTAVGSEVVRVLQTIDVWMRTGSTASRFPTAFPHQQPPNTHF